MKFPLFIVNGGNVKNYLFVMLIFALPTQAQITFYNDAMGLPLGTANTVGNTTFYNDAMGLPLGTANRVGNTTFYNNALGLPLGTAQTPQPIAPSPYSAPLYSTPTAPIFPPSPLFPTSPRGM
jgi:hypothetical protein